MCSSLRLCALAILTCRVLRRPILAPKATEQLTQELHDGLQQPFCLLFQSCTVCILKEGTFVPRKRHSGGTGSLYGLEGMETQPGLVA